MTEETTNNQKTWDEGMRLVRHKQNLVDQIDDLYEELDSVDARLNTLRSRFIDEPSEGDSAAGSEEDDPVTPSELKSEPVAANGKWPTFEGGGSPSRLLQAMRADPLQEWDIAKAVRITGDNVGLINNSFSQLTKLHMITRVRKGVYRPVLGAGGGRL